MPGTEVRALVQAGHLLEGFGPGDAPRLHRDAGLLVENGMVAALGPFVDLRRAHPDVPLIGGPDAAVIPGLVNAHHHVGLTPLQLGSDDWPLELWFASRLASRDVDLRLDTLFSAFEMIASGVTTVQHLHSRAPGSAEDVLGAARKVIGAYREIGMRASYSMALRDQNRLVYEDDAAFTARLPAELRPALRAYFSRFSLPLAEQAAVSSELLREHAGDPLVRVQVAPANLHWLSEKALALAADLSARFAAPMHMHLVETPYQKAYAEKRTGRSALAHIHALGLTGPQLTIGHGVWLSDADIGICAATGTRICHNCSSNMRLKSGTAPVNRFLAEGIPVAIGIDEAGINDDRDMLQEMRLVLRRHREPGIDAAHPSAATVLRMATEDGAGTTPFAGSIGRLSPGYSADLVLFDWPAVIFPYQHPDIGFVDVLVQRAKAAAIKTVMIAGETVYAGGRFTRIDREAVLGELAARLARPLTAAESARRDLARAVFPHVREFYDGYLGSWRPEPSRRRSTLPSS